MKYKYKPREVEAIQYNGNNKKEVMEFTEGETPLSGSLLQCKISLIVNTGDWILKEHNKSFPVLLLCTDELFKEMFERV